MPTMKEIVYHWYLIINLTKSVILNSLQFEVSKCILLFISFIVIQLSFMYVLETTKGILTLATNYWCL